MICEPKHLATSFCFFSSKVVKQPFFLLYKKSFLNQVVCMMWPMEGPQGIPHILSTPEVYRLQSFHVCPLSDSSTDTTGANWTPPPCLLSGTVDTSARHVFPIRPVLSCRETGNHSQPQTHPDAGNPAETAAAPVSPGPRHHAASLPGTARPSCLGPSQEQRWENRMHPTAL